MRCSPDRVRRYEWLSEGKWAGAVETSLVKGATSNLDGMPAALSTLWVICRFEMASSPPRFPGAARTKGGAGALLQFPILYRVVR